MKSFASFRALNARNVQQLYQSRSHIPTNSPKPALINIFSKFRSFSSSTTDKNPITNSNSERTSATSNPNVIIFDGPNKSSSAAIDNYNGTLAPKSNPEENAVEDAKPTDVLPVHDYFSLTKRVANRRCSLINSRDAFKGSGRDWKPEYVDPEFGNPEMARTLREATQNFEQNQQSNAFYSTAVIFVLWFT